MADWPFRSLESPRLKLRPLAPGDAGAYLDIFSEPEAMLYWTGAPIRSIDEARDLLDRDLEWVKAGDALCWGAALPESDRLIGKVSLYLFSRQNRRAEIGYILDRRYWNRGLMSEALAAVLDFAFDHLELHRIEADVDPDHAASLALLSKFGFRREGLLRERWRVHGAWHDTVMLGLLAGDYVRRADRERA
ncbi:MAG: GNAT family N-acetyltransferase [Xanthomonadales bacterium]